MLRSLLVALFVFPGCSSAPLMACAPGTQATCPCPGGGTGVLVCRVDGSGFDACVGCPGGPAPDLSSTGDLAIGPGPDMAEQGDAAMPDMADTCGDGKRDGTETDVDCGGVCPACGLGKACLGAADCASGKCISGTCVSQTPLVLGFGTPMSYPTGVASGTPFSITAADLTGEGAPDLIVANNTSNNVSVLLGSGGGIFQQAVLYPTADSPWQGVVSDVDGDGRPDLVVSAWLLGNPNGFISVLLGNGKAPLSPAASYPAGPQPSFLAVGELNGDQEPDLAISGQDGNLYVMINGIGGGFKPAVGYPSGVTLAELAVADFNSDGKADIVAADRGGNWVLVHFGNGDGTFQSPPAGYTTGGVPLAMAVGDFDGDGKPDVATSSDANGTIDVLLNKGDGTLKPRTSYMIAAGVSPENVVAADFDLDGALDLATSTAFTGGRVAVFRGNGDGTFKSASSFATLSSYPIAVATADFDRDGKPDLAICAAGMNGTVDSVDVFLNTSK